MRNDLPSNDPRMIWQNQPTEPSAMTLEKMGQKTQELHTKNRRALLRGLTVPLLILGISGCGIAWFDAPVLRVIFALAFTWGIAGQYFMKRGIWSGILPGHAALSTGLESYRQEVERRHYLSGRFLLWSLGPVVLALVAFAVPLLSLGIRRGMLLNMTPFLVLMGMWIVGVFVIRLRDVRELQREIEELNDIEKANG